jgi:hypothetical protein
VRFDDPGEAADVIQLGDLLHRLVDRIEAQSEPWSRLGLIPTGVVSPRAHGGSADQCRPELQLVMHRLELLFGQVVGLPVGTTRRRRAGPGAPGREAHCHAAQRRLRSPQRRTPRSPAQRDGRTSGLRGEEAAVFDGGLASLAEFLELPQRGNPTTKW